jgi:organic radical activating enzyme
MKQGATYTMRKFMDAIYIAPFTAKAVLLFHVLKNQAITIEGFCDNDAEIQGKSYGQRGIMNPKDAYGKNPDATVILCEKKHYATNEAQFAEIGFQKILKLDDVLNTEDVGAAISSIDQMSFSQIVPKQVPALERLSWTIVPYALPAGMKNSVTLPVVEIIVTEKCTLKCEGCANMMQYYAAPRHMSFAQICEDIDILMSKVDFIRYPRLFGGEAFMHEDLGKAIKHMMHYKEQYGRLNTTTNGTIIPSEDTLSAMKDAGMVVNISDYGRLSRNMDELKNAFDKYRIPYVVNKMAWYAYQQLMDGTKRDAQKIFNACRANCFTMRNGRLYHCPFLAHGETLKAFPCNERNHLAIHNNAITKMEVRHFIESAKAAPGCAWCSGYDMGNLIPVAKQIIRPLRYSMFI